MFVRSRLFTMFYLAGLLGITAVLVIAVGQKTAAINAAANNDTHLFLPLLTSSGAPTPPPPAGAAAFFVETNFKTSNGSMRVDANGGMHLAYYYYEAAGGQAPTSAVYLYCPANCANGNQWNGVMMGTGVNEVQLELTPNGQPRLLYRVPSSSNGNEFYYAACDSDCTNPTQWEIAFVASNEGMATLELNDDSLPQRYFALDPAGRPRFIYNDRDTWSEPDHLGTFYAYCDTVCTDPNNWFEVRVGEDNGNPGNFRYEKFYYPSLTFTPSGQPRFVADGVSLQDEFFLYYVVCDNNCGITSSWQTVPLYERGSGSNVSFDIEVDSQARPRIAFYQGARLGGQGERLSYAWCNSICVSVGNWQIRDLGLGVNNGRGPDLELTAGARPRIAYSLYSVGGIGYSWCDTNCESAGGTWQHQVVESGTDLAHDWPVAYPPHCDGGIWDGLTPTLSLDSSGNPRLAYDATYHARCWYNPDTGEWEPWSQFRLVKRAVRGVFFDQP